MIFHIGGKGKFCTNEYNADIVFEEKQFGFNDQFVEDDPVTDLSDKTIDGLGCVDNKTLNFYALDLETQKVLGERIGLDFGKNGSDKKAKFVIASPDQEVVYEMNTNLISAEKYFKL